MNGSSIKSSTIISKFGIVDLYRVTRKCKFWNNATEYRAKVMKVCNHR